MRDGRKDTKGIRDYHARISKKKRDDLLKCFVQDLTATQASKMCKVNRNTGNHWYRFFRTFIKDQIIKPPRLSGEVEIDQAFFRTRKRKRYVMVEGKPVPKPSIQVPVMGFVQRGGKVYTHIIKRMDRRTLNPLIFMVVEKGSTIYSDKWRSFDTLSSDGYAHHSINHRRGFAKRNKELNIHINTIESFWSFCKRRLAKFNGLALSTFPLHIKECEFRFNNRPDILKVLRRMLKAEDERLEKMLASKKLPPRMAGE